MMNTCDHEHGNGCPLCVSQSEASDPDEMIEDMDSRIGDLEDRVADLEAQLATDLQFKGRDVPRK